MQITQQQPPMYRVVTMATTADLTAPSNHNSVPSNSMDVVKRTLLETNGDALLHPSQLPPINSPATTFNFTMATSDSSHGNGNSRVPPAHGDGGDLGEFSFDDGNDANNNGFHGNQLHSNQLDSLHSNQNLGADQGQGDPLEDILFDFPHNDVGFIGGDFMKSSPHEQFDGVGVMTTGSDPFNANLGCLVTDNTLMTSSPFDVFNSDIFNST